MTRDKIKEAIDDIDDEILLIIIDCVKELVCKGIYMYTWDRDTIMDEFDNVCKKKFYRMTKEDYMHLPKERLAELLAERDAQHEINYVPIEQITLPCYAPGGICTNPHRDCINCPKQFGDTTTIVTTTTLEEWIKENEK